MTFTALDLEKINSILGEAQPQDGDAWFWQLRNETSGRVLAITLSQNVNVGASEPITIVSVLTHQGYVELHGITKFLVIEPDEVMFIAKNNHVFSSLVVGANCTCSQYGNIQASLLKLPLPDVDGGALMAAMQLALAESSLESLSE